jgi:hypothetical protein
MASSTAQSLYDKLAGDRLMFLTRARRCSLLTIPTLVPPEGHGPATVYATPYQSVGAQGVNNLASKLLLALLPNSPFFRLQLDDFVLNKLTQGDTAATSQVDKTLNRMERAVMTEVESIGLRAPIFEVLKQLIVGGNALLYLPASGRPRVFKLDSYVVQRDPYGNLMRAIMREEVSVDLLSAADKASVETQEGDSGDDDPSQGSVDTAVVYTHYYRDGNLFRVHQEVNGKVLPGSGGMFPVDKGPVMALRWSTVDGEDYGRGYVEEYLGDLVTLEALMQAIIQGAAASARLLILVSPNGTTRLKDVTEAPNGAAVAGAATDVTMLQTNKGGDFAVAQNTVAAIVERLSYAFMLVASQRNAERVTAEEVRYMANQLETALGGVYSVLAQDLQLPLAVRLMDRMTKQKRLPKLPKGIVTPTVVTGLDALGRGNDLDKLSQLATAIQPLGPQVLSQFINVGDYITRVGTALGIDMDGLVKSAQDLATDQQNAQQAAQSQTMSDTMGKMAANATPNAVAAIGKGMNAQANPSAAPAPAAS